MTFAGQFVRKGKNSNLECEGPYSVFDSQKCPDCQTYTAVTVKNGNNEIVWFCCKLCGNEVDLLNAIRA